MNRFRSIHLSAPGRPGRWGRAIRLVALGAGVVLPAVGALSGCTNTQQESSSPAALAESARASTTPAVPPTQGPGPWVAHPPTSTQATATTKAPAPPPVAVIAATPADGTQGVDPLAPISVTVAKGRLDSVRLTNPDGEDIRGTLARDRRSWSAIPELGYGRTYTVTASAKNAAGQPSRSRTSFTTLVPGNRTAASSFPHDGMTVGVAQPISIRFDEPIADRAAAERAITVTTSPKVHGGLRWITDQEVRWRPVTFFKPGTKVSVGVKIYGKNLGNGIFGQQDLAQKFVIGRSMVAEIDDNRKQMLVKRNGTVITSIPVSMGRDEYPTYNGVHVVEEKYQTKIMDSRTWGLTGAGAYRVEVAWATRISDSGEFVHAAPWSVDSQGYENVSHGCVNVSTEAAKWFYDTFIPGDPVIIKNTVGPPLEVWDGYGDYQLSFTDYVS